MNYKQRRWLLNCEATINKVLKTAGSGLTFRELYEAGDLWDENGITDFDPLQREDYTVNIGRILGAYEFLNWTDYDLAKALGWPLVDYQHTDQEKR